MKGGWSTTSDPTQQSHLLSAKLMSGTVPGHAWTCTIMVNVSWALISARQQGFL